MAKADKQHTSLDVVENFITAARLESIDKAPGHALWALGEEMRKFSDAYTPAPLRPDEHPVYIGGWPSANFWMAMNSPLLPSTLLYSGQVVVKDPLIDWFSLDRYQNEHVIGSRQGFLADDGIPDIRTTRNFLHNTLPALLQLKPLIDSAAIVLVAGESAIKHQKNEIDLLMRDLLQVPSLAPDKIVELFDPSDLPKDDRIRGAFVFAGGDRDAQLGKVLERTLQYFVREYLLAKSHCAEYAAPWRFEQYVCEHGLESPLLLSESQRVVRALWSSGLPIFAGLTPKILSEVRDDDAFAGFRADLFDAYRGLPTSASNEDFARYVAEAESVKLKPRLEQAEKLARRGPLARMGIELLEASMRMTTAYAIDAAKHDVGPSTVLQGAASYLLDRVTGQGRDPNPISIWTKLSRHHRNVQSELDKIQITEGQGQEDPSSRKGAKTRSWYIAKQPSSSITITPGLVFIDDVSKPLEEEENQGYSEGPYRLCECGSGLKWRFCCRAVPKSMW